jgi:23S rRNA (cytosine1962-C5)-methyltransferase
VCGSKGFDSWAALATVRGMSKKREKRERGPVVPEVDLGCPVVVLQRGREKSLARRNPWVSSHVVAVLPEDAADGDVVAVCGARGQFLGIGHYQSEGSIRVRVLSFDPCPIDANFWEARLSAAWQMRVSLGLAKGEGTTAFRLVHGEGDLLPGLMIDWYAGHAVIECHSKGMERAEPQIREALQKVLGTQLKSIWPDPRRSALTCTEIRETGLRFHVDWAKGQKTGFVIDQRVNRRLVGEYAAGQRVLNAFSYSGGFSVYALAAGAEHVTSVECNAQALDWARLNVKLNGFEPQQHEAVKADAFDYLKDDEKTYGLVVLDPPAFAEHLTARHQAIQAYRRINAMGMRRVAPGGMLFTFSCSPVVTTELFRGAVTAAALDVGRPVQILHELTQPPDHPVSLFQPEGGYLKGLALRVS